MDSSLKAQDLETLTYCELIELRKFSLWSGERTAKNTLRKDEVFG